MAITEDTKVSGTLKLFLGILGIVILGTASACAMYYAFDKKLDKLDSRFDSMLNRMDAKDKHDEERFKELSDKIDESENQSSSKIDFIFRLFGKENPYARTSALRSVSTPNP